MRSRISPRLAAFAPALPVALAALVSLGVAGPPPDPATCPSADPVADKYRYLRNLSLDLRGVIPSVEELEALDAEEDVPASVIDAYLDTDGFADRVVRLHRGLLWNNVSNLTLVNNDFALKKTTPALGNLYWRNDPAIAYRGDNVPCLDEPATFDPVTGYPETTLQPDGTNREGYVMVSPYWDPSSSIKVCAFDAQESDVSASGNPCNTLDGGSETSCGCGPALDWCRYSTVSMPPILDAMAKDVELRLADNLAEDRSYLDLFTEQAAYLNGPLVHYWKYMKDIPQNVSLEPAPVPLDRLPDLTFSDADTWVRVDLGPEHSGILTSSVYMLRFATNRARANRFYNAFLCQPFTAPAGGLPLPDEVVPTLNLQERDGCKYCHALLEPAASHWGRWTMGGGGYLDPVLFPPLSAECETCATGGGGCGASCDSYYVTTALTTEEVPYLGWLRSYEFLREEHWDNVEVGPSELVMSTVVDGRLPSCVARKAATWLLGREVAPEEEEWLAETALHFASSGYSYRELVRSIVTSEVYRRVR